MIFLMTSFVVTERHAVRWSETPFFKTKPVL